MAAYIDFVFQKRFLLNEENLRKISDIILKRINDKDKYKILYTVYRNDSFCFDTENIIDVINEDNSKEQKINRILILVKDIEKKDFVLDLEFDKKETVSFRIKADNKDFVYLLSSDLKDYIKNNVAVCLRYSEETVRLINRYFPLLVILFFTLIIPIKGMYNNIIDKTILNNVLNSNDILEKVNFIIENNYKTSNDYNFVIIYLIVFIIVFLITIFINRILSVFIISNIFIIGKEKDVYESRLKRRSNIIWVIVVGLILSVVSGLIVWKITT